MNMLNMKLMAAVSAIAMCGFSVLPASAYGGFWFNHPRRAEVLHRDAALNRELNCDRGLLSGHYGQLKAEDRAIHRQEQRDAFFDGGHITRGEQFRLNQEENHLQRQINRDYR
jgi:hypothetical protein